MKSSPHQYAFGHLHKSPYAGSLSLICCNSLLSVSNAAHQKYLISQIPAKADTAPTYQAPTIPIIFCYTASSKRIRSPFLLFSQFPVGTDRKKKKLEKKKINKIKFTPQNSGIPLAIHFFLLLSQNLDALPEMENP